MKDIMGDNYFFWIFPFRIINLMILGANSKFGGYYFENRSDTATPYEK